MEDKEYRITMGSAFNNAVRLVSTGIVSLETEDIGAEIAELAKVLFDAIIPQMKALGGEGDTRPTKRSYAPSSKPASGSPRSGGKTGKPYEGPDTKDLKGDVTLPQVKLIHKLMEEKDHGEDIEWNDVENLSKADASAMIERLFAAAPLG